MIRGKLQDGFRTMFGGFHVRRNSTDSPNTLNSPTSKWTVETPGSNSGGSPRTELVGEIDTSAPFQSVKAALSLFADAAAATGSSPRGTGPPGSAPNIKPNIVIIKKPKTADDQRVLEKETQIHLALKELEDLKERLKHSEASKTQAIRDLERANRTLQELTNKLEIVSESKQIAIESAESAKQRSQEFQGQNKSLTSQDSSDADAWKQDVDNEREQYRATSAQLISVKQELTMLRQDFDGTLEAKLAAFQQAADAQHVTRVNKERVARMTKEISGMRETLAQVKLATTEAQELQNKHDYERESRLLSHSRAKVELEIKIKSLRDENEDLQPRKVLEGKLEETNEAIKVLKEQLTNVRDSDMLSLNNAFAELEDAKKELERTKEEENRQRTSVNALQQELDNIKREYREVEEKTTEAEKRVLNLKAEVEGYKTQLKAGEGILDHEQELLCDDMKAQLRQLESESEKARQEEEGIRKKIAEARDEEERAGVETREAEERLKIVQSEVEEAKAAEKSAGDRILNHSSSSLRMGEDGTSSSNIGRIKLSASEFEILSKKAEEARADADVKIATIMAQIETIKASEKEAVDKMEAFRIEKERMESGIEEAVKQAEMAEAAKKVVEGELSKWRHRESFKSNY